MRVQNFHKAKERMTFILLGNMSWTTIYIVGKSDFKEEVRKRLEHSNQRYMPGFIDGGSTDIPADLYWLDGRTGLRDFKEAIGGKLIWKHRLHFYSTLEEYLMSQKAMTENQLSEREREMIAQMQAA